MKKIFQTFFIFLVFLTLSGCGFFGSTELAIASITTEEKDDKLYMVITYTDEFLEPSYFELAQGEDGARGNGIADIITDITTKPGYTLVTVKYTDTSLHDENFELPHGVSIDNITVEAKVDAEGNPLVDENGEPTGEEELVITFTSGKEPIRIPYAKPQDGKDGREIEISKNDTDILWRYVGEDDESWKSIISLDSLKGKDGSSIEKISVVEDEGVYYLAVQYIDKDEYEYVPFEQLQQPAQWHTGNNYPPSNLGKIGDFYLDKTNALIYKKQGENQWGDPIVDFGSPNGEFKVEFIADKGTIIGSDEIWIAYGNCVYNDEESIPWVDAPDGYTFVGWFLTSSPKLEIDGKFTDLTPVYKALKLYAYFEPDSE